MDKHCLVLTGAPRTVEFLIDTFNKIIDKFNCDVFIYTTLDCHYRDHTGDAIRYNYKLNELLPILYQLHNVKMVKVAEMDRTYDEEFLKLYNEVCQRDYTLDEKHKIERHLQYVFKWKKGVDMMRQYEFENGFKYGKLIRTRLDFAIKSTIGPLSRLDLFDVDTKPGELFLNDMFVAGDRDLVDFICFNLGESYKKRDILHRDGQNPVSVIAPEYKLGILLADNKINYRIIGKGSINTNINSEAFVLRESIYNILQSGLMQKKQIDV